MELAKPGRETTSVSLELLFNAATSILQEIKDYSTDKYKHENQLSLQRIKYLLL